jgi:LmbE family N-acetylglucosaminyl deacetylase
MSSAAIDALPKPGERVVVTVAHPDDESFGTGSLIALAAANGAQVTVICATRGEAGERLHDRTTDHLPLGVVREQELRAAAETLGVEAVEVLDFVDSGFDGPPPDGSLCAATLDDVAEVLLHRLEPLRPDVVLTIDGSDGHRDHVRIREATLQAVARIERPIRVVQSCLPNSLMRRWIEETRTLNPDAVYLDLDLDSLGRPDLELTRVDTSPYLDAREAAIACHRSQRSPYDGLSDGLRRAFLTNDFIVVN